MAAKQLNKRQRIKQLRESAHAETNEQKSKTKIHPYTTLGK